MPLGGHFSRHKTTALVRRLATVFPSLAPGRRDRVRLAAGPLAVAPLQVQSHCQCRPAQTLPLSRGSAQTEPGPAPWSSSSTARPSAAGPTTWRVGRTAPPPTTRGSWQKSPPPSRSRSPSTSGHPRPAAAGGFPSPSGPAPGALATSAPAQPAPSWVLVAAGPPMLGSTILYWWPEEGWPLGRLRRRSRSPHFG